jgi:hypothetical protein
MRFNGEFISAETGEEETLTYITRSEAMSYLRKMGDGDALVLNAVPE